MPINVFFCYAHEDEKLLKKLQSHLKPLQRQGLIELWHDSDIRAGLEWEKEIKRHLDESQLVLLLISPGFMDSEYCYSIEMKQAIERHKQGKAHLIPVILRHIYWQGMLGQLQALPKDAIPVVDRYWHTVDEALFDVVEGIRRVVIDLTSQASANLSTQPSEIPLVRTIQKEHDPHSNADEELTGLGALKNLEDEYSVLEKGNEFFDSERYGDALLAYEKALKLNQGSLVAYNNMGRIFHRLGKYNEALKLYDKALSFNYNDPVIHFNRGILLKEMSSYHDALIDLDKALLNDPLYEDAALNKGEVLYKLKLYLESIDAFKKAILIAPDHVSNYLRLGVLLRYIGCHEQALIMYEQAISLSPDSSDALAGKGYALAGLEHNKKSLKVFNQAIRLDPQNVLAYVGKGVVLNTVGRHNYALETQMKAWELDKNSINVYTGIANAFRSLKSFDESLLAYNNAIRLDSQNAHALNGKGRVLLEMERYPEAIDTFKKSMNIDPDNPYCYFKLSLIFGNIGNAKLHLYYQFQGSERVFKRQRLQERIDIEDIKWL